MANIVQQFNIDLTREEVTAILTKYVQEHISEYVRVPPGATAKITKVGFVSNNVGGDPRHDVPPIPVLRGACCTVEFPDQGLVPVTGIYPGSRH